MSAVLYTGRILGHTNAGVLVAQQNSVTLHADGFIRWTDANGNRRAVKVEGALGELIRTIWTGVNGIPAAAGNRIVQFGVPRINTAN